jgi:tetratricopeptide (TPR) repeat protein
MTEASDDMRKASSVTQSYLYMAAAMFRMFEATRSTALPDRSQLAMADHHASEACRMSPSNPDAWGTLTLVRNRQGRYEEAVAAARHAVALAPTGGLHYLRLAAVTWGEERIRSARRTITWNPEMALAHVLIATVHIARGHLDAALEELQVGCAKWDMQTLGQTKVDSIGLHWLRGLVLLALGDQMKAEADFEHEILTADTRYVDGREAQANSAYALGAVRLQPALGNGVTPAPYEVLKELPSHPTVVSGIFTSTPGGAELTATLNPVDEAMMKGIRLALQHRHDDAARQCREAIASAPPGGAGWLLPVEPLLNMSAQPEAWAATMFALRQRAM